MRSIITYTYLNIHEIYYNIHLLKHTLAHECLNISDKLIRLLTLSAKQWANRRLDRQRNHMLYRI